MPVLIPAAGSGSRMKAGKNKLLIELEGESLIYWTLKSVFSSSLIDPKLINKCALELEKNNAVILATKVTDTIKIVDDKGYIQKTPDRKNLWAAQTPQGFSVKSLRKAHAMAIKNNWLVTDDASLFEILNWQVKIIEGNSSNIKITSPLDLKIAKLFLKNF